MESSCISSCRYTGTARCVHLVFRISFQSFDCDCFLKSDVVHIWRHGATSPAYLTISASEQALRHHLWCRRRQVLAKSLLPKGIGTLILEGAYYGSRKPRDQLGSKLCHVADLIKLGAVTILEAVCFIRLLHAAGVKKVSVHPIDRRGSLVRLPPQDNSHCKSSLDTELPLLCFLEASNSLMTACTGGSTSYPSYSCHLCLYPASEQTYPNSFIIYYPASEHSAGCRVWCSSLVLCCIVALAFVIFLFLPSQRAERGKATPQPWRAPRACQRRNSLNQAPFTWKHTCSCIMTCSHGSRRTH